MKKDYIMVIDSGLGGVLILKQLIKKYQNESFIYLADNKLSPYGNKNKKVVTQNIINLITKYTLKYSIKLVVFACNTLTAMSIKTVRKKFKNLKFVGTEPPIRKIKNNEKTLVLTTFGTFKYSNLLKQSKNNKNFDFVTLKDIAKLLDTNFFDRKKIIDSLQLQLPKKNYKNIVLGCTHYYYIKNEIKQVLNNDNLMFFTSIKGVINRVDNILTKENNIQTIKIFCTKQDEYLDNTIKFLLNN